MKLKTIYQLTDGRACNICVVQASAPTPEGFLDQLYDGDPGGCPTPEELSTPAAKARTQLSESDAGFIRFAEDLFAVLAAKGVVSETDLPLSAQHKLKARADLRKKL